MKKLIYIVLFAIVFLLVGCESYFFHFAITKDLNLEFTIDEATGNFTDTQTITPESVRDALDIPEKSDIKSVSVEGAWGQLILLTGNVAQTIRVSMDIWDGSQWKPSFSNYSMPISTFTNSSTLNGLLAGGVFALNWKINGWVKEIDNSNMTVRVTGNSDPAGQRVHLTLKVKVRYSVRYDACVDIFGLFFEGEECPAHLMPED